MEIKKKMYKERKGSQSLRVFSSIDDHSDIGTLVFGAKKTPLSGYLTFLGYPQGPGT